MATARTRVEIIMAILLMIPPLGTAEHITGHHPRTVMVKVVVAAAAAARLLPLEMDMLRLCLHRLCLHRLMVPPPPPPTKIPMVVDIILRHHLPNINHLPTVHHLRHHHHRRRMLV